MLPPCVLLYCSPDAAAHSVAFALGMMAERPDLATRLALEGRKALKGSTFFDDPDAIRSALEKTDVVKNFFMESVRLYPLAPALGGVCTDDVVIQTRGGGKEAEPKEYLLPKGTSLYFPNIVLQRLPGYSGPSEKDPNEIGPDRWSVPPTQQPFLHTFNSGPVSSVCTESLFILSS